MRVFPLKIDILIRNGVIAIMYREITIARNNSPSLVTTLLHCDTNAL